MKIRSFCLKKTIVCCAFLVSSCSGIVNDMNSLSVERVTFPARYVSTVSCLDVAAVRHNFLLEDTGDRIGDIHRYQIRKVGGQDALILDISAQGKNTTLVSAIVDRRKQDLISGLDGILGYCKRQIG